MKSPQRRGSIDIVQQLRTIGYIACPQLFSPPEAAAIRMRLDAYLKQSHPGVVMETDGMAVRAVHGLHLYDDFFASLTEDARLLLHIERALQDRCYVHQSKVNMKERLRGAAWPWHQDFIYWRKADNILEPRLVNVAVLLNDVEEGSGPLCLVPGSHLAGDLTDIELRDDRGWEGNVSEKLTYQIGEARIERLLAERGSDLFVGRAGDVLFFDPLIVHSSSANTLPVNRAMLFFSYNAVSNCPAPSAAPARPLFLCSRDFIPLTARTPARALSHLHWPPG
jgi:ectoine hydroxylase